MTTKAEIEVKNVFVGFHCWPEAPQEVAFLRFLHRHVFTVRVRVAVGHHDRQVEFFILQNDVGNVISNNLLPHLEQERRMSCEDMALFISRFLVNVHGYTVTQISVSEDDENTAILSVVPEPQESTRRHVYWRAGEPDCPSDIKAPNGELHTIRCKLCGLDSPRSGNCLSNLDVNKAE